MLSFYIHDYPPDLGSSCPNISLNLTSKGWRFNVVVRHDTVDRKSFTEPRSTRRHTLYNLYRHINRFSLDSATGEVEQCSLCGAPLARKNISCHSYSPRPAVKAELDEFHILERAPLGPLFPLKLHAGVLLDLECKLTSADRALLHTGPVFQRWRDQSPGLQRLHWRTYRSF